MLSEILRTLTTSSPSSSSSTSSPSSSSSTSSPSTSSKTSEPGYLNISDKTKH